MMIGCKFQDEQLNGVQEAPEYMKSLRNQRTTRILHSDLDVWRAVGVGHRAPSKKKVGREQDEARAAEAKQEGDRRRANEERDARSDVRNGQTIPRKPSPADEREDNNGPRCFTEFVQAAVFF